MKFHLMSDLHLEFGHLEKMPEAGEHKDKNLLLAGDVHVAHAPELKRFLQDMCAAYNRVLYVPGNHEYYGGCIQKVDAELQSYADEMGNLHFLNPDYARIEMDGEVVYVVGATMWTDFDGGDCHTMYAAKRFMNDYRQITWRHGDKYYTRVYPELIHGLNTKHRAYITSKLDELRDEKVIVMTHHAPLHLCIDEKYRTERDRETNLLYHNTGLEGLFTFCNFNVWVHGHTHHRYQKEVADKRLMCNPRGYKGHEAIAYLFEPLEFSV